MSTSVFTWLLASCVNTLYSSRPRLLQDLLERLRRIRNNRDRVRLLRDQLPNDVGALLRIGIGRAGHGKVDPVLRGKLFDAPCMRSNHTIPIRLTTVTILIRFVWTSVRTPWPREALTANAAARMNAKQVTIRASNSASRPR